VADLAYSESECEEPWFDSIYRNFFPSLVWHNRCSGDTLGQRLGHDRAIYLPTGKVLFVDEKLDRTTYKNFALEFIGNDRVTDMAHRLGWIEKPLQIDYILYAFMQYPRKVYLLPWEALQSAWFTNKAKWIEEFGTFPVYNPQGHYNSVICPVPRGVVYSAIVQHCFWKEFDSECE